MPSSAPSAAPPIPGERESSRYASLLEPIRDLAKNWCIDVAKDLEDYLEELETIAISFDGGATKLDFREAALLIQGSAAIYSRKVE
jgi:condensin-2 complex subunit H2